MLLRADGFSTAGYVRLIGQEPAPSKCVLMCTSRVVRNDMRDWIWSHEGDKWTVKLDVRGLGGHLDTTSTGWSATLASREKVVISRLVLISVLPLNFQGRLRVVRTMFLPGALHGIEASLLALRKLRSSIFRDVWSRRQPMANVGAVRACWMVFRDCDPAHCVVSCRFRVVRRYLAYRPSEVGRICCLLDMVREGCPGHGPVHLLVASATGIGFQWDPHVVGWVRLGLPVLSNLAGLIQHYESSIAAGLRAREGFRGGPLLDAAGTLQLLNFSHVLERDKALLRGAFVGGVWNGLLLGRVREQPVPCWFRGGPDGDGHHFGECTHPLLVESLKNHEFHDLMRMDKGHWNMCLLWHGWLPLLSGVNGDSPWQSRLLRVPVICLRVLLGPTLHGCPLSGVFLMGSMLMMLLFDCLILLMFGVMVVWFWIRFLVPLWCWVLCQSFSPGLESSQMGPH